MKANHRSAATNAWQHRQPRDQDILDYREDQAEGKEDGSGWRREMDEGERSERVGRWLEFGRSWSGGKLKIETEKHEERGERAAPPYEKDRISGGRGMGHSFNVAA